MSGCSVSSSCRARDAVGRHHGVEAPHGQVGADQVDDVGVVLDHQHPGRARFSHARSSGASASEVTVPRPPGSSTGRLTQNGCPDAAAQLDAAAVGVDDALGDRQPEPGAGGRPAPRRSGSNGVTNDLVGHADPVVGDAMTTTPPASPTAATTLHPGAGRVVAQRRCRAG